MNTKIQEFLRIATEIRCRLDEAKGKPEWWEDLQNLTVDLQSVWEELKHNAALIAKCESPAFVVYTKYRGYSSPKVLQKFEEFADRVDEPRWQTMLCSFDPYTGDKWSGNFFWSEASSEEWWDRASRQINMWIRAVSGLASTTPNPLPESAIHLDSDFTEEARMSGEWADVFGVSKTKINTMRNDKRIREKSVTKQLFRVHKDDLPAGMKSQASRNDAVSKAEKARGGKRSRGKKRSVSEHIEH